MPRKKKIKVNDSDLGDINSFSLDSGLRVFNCFREDFQTVNIQFWVKTGSALEGEHLGCGLSHFLEHMFFSGSTKYPNKQISERIHELGGNINAYTSHGITVFYIDILNRYFTEAVDILASMITEPLFPLEGFKEEKNVILREKERNLDDPVRHIMEASYRTMFRIHPVRHPVIGYIEKIRSVDNEMLRNYYERNYSPLKSFIVACGGIQNHEFCRIVSEKFSKWRLGNLNEQIIASEPVQKEARKNFLSFDDPVTRICRSWHIPPVSHSDNLPLNVLSMILGAGSDSRLVKKIRREKELAINIIAQNYNNTFCGKASVFAECHEKNAEKVLQMIDVEIEKLIAEGVDENEFLRISRGMENELYECLNSGMFIANQMGQSVLSYDSPTYFLKNFEILQQLEPKDIQKLAEKYFINSNSTTVVQQKNSAEKSERLSKKSQKIPKPEKIELNNNLRFILLKDRKFPILRLNAFLPGGTLYEGTPEKAGLSYLAAKCLSTGTKSYTEDEIASFFEIKGAKFSTSSARNSISMNFESLSENAAELIPYLDEIINAPSFPAKPFAREKNRQIEQIKSIFMNPEAAADNELRRILYGSHSYGNPISGTIESVSGFKRDHIRDFYKKISLNPEKIVVSLSGDFSESLKNDFIKVFEKIQKPQSSQFELKMPEFPEKNTVNTIHLPRKQSFIVCAVPICSNLHKDIEAFTFLMAALNNMASKFFNKLRNKEGLAYYSGFYDSAGMLPGFATFFAGTEEKSVEKVLDIINTEIKKLSEKGLNKKEFFSAKTTVLYNLGKKQNDSFHLAAESSLDEYYNKGYEFPWQKNIIYENFNRKELNAIIKKYFKSSIKTAVVTVP